MKSRSIIRILYASSFVLLLLLLAQTSARADEFTATIDTSSLIGNPAGPYQVGFALINTGSTTPDPLDTATVSDITFGGGTGGAVDTNPDFTLGGSSGTLATGFSLVDSAPIDGISAFFTPGASVSFDVTITTPDPVDEFIFVIFNGAGQEIATTDPDDFLVVATPVAGAVVTPTDYSIVTTPEPGSLLLLSCGLIAVLGLGLMRKRDQLVA
jgi:hypothetical protein